MSILYILVPLALGIVSIAVTAYVWSARSGQFDDLVTPAIRLLIDDPTSAPRPATEPATGAASADAQPIRSGSAPES